MAFPEPFIIEPIGPHTNTIIFIHGRDSDGEELSQQLFEGKTSGGQSIKDIPALSGCKWVFPNARERFSTVFQEYLTEWFDIYSLTDTDSEQERQIDGLRESIQHIHNVIHTESRLVPTKSIILSGISQGFAVASHVLLSSHHELAGLIGFCGWIPFRNRLNEVLELKLTLADFFSRSIGLDPSTTKISLEKPIFIGHAKDDDVVDFQHGLDSSATLQRFGMNVEFRGYEGCQHWISEPQAYDDLVRFLTLLLK